MWFINLNHDKCLVNNKTKFKGNSSKDNTRHMIKMVNFTPNKRTLALIDQTIC